MPEKNSNCFVSRDLIEERKIDRRFEMRLAHFQLYGTFTRRDCGEDDHGNLNITQKIDEIMMTIIII